MLTGWRERALLRRPEPGDAAPPMLGQPGHSLYLYDSEDALLDVLVRYVAEGRYHGQRTLVLSSPERLDRLHQRLAGHGLADWAVGHSAEACLDRVLLEGVPDRERFRAAMAELLSGQTPETTRVCGEMVGLLAERGSMDGALELERLWNELVAEHPVLRLCAYPRDRVEQHDAVCLAHDDFRR